MLSRYSGALLVLAVTAACASHDLSCGSIATPHIQLNSQLKTIDVSGIPPAYLRELTSRAQANSLSADDWSALLRVSVKSSGSGVPPPVTGSYRVVDGVLRFTPMFPLDDGREYAVTFDPGRLPGSSTTGAVTTAVVSLPAVVRTPTTTVTHVYPSGDVVPANQLRMYLYFSAPMDWRSGYDYVKLLDDRGEEVVDTFLPLDADFWNTDRTRYTVFFDPGRVKRGILPNRQMGRALVAGRGYTLVVKREWRDGHGQPLKEEFRRAFTAGPAIEQPLSMNAWKIVAPAAGTREPLSVTFPAALDHGLLQRALGVARNDAPVDGDTAIDAAETHWTFTPRVPWQSGGYQLVALEFLEDLAGNRIGRAFEVDNFERTDSSPQPARTTLTFQIDAPAR